MRISDWSSDVCSSDLRAEVGIEADFHGAMDGASKFVKGDAIAALLILGVNIIAGIALGMIYHGLSAAEAARVYVTLAVGDALEIGRASCRERVCQYV